MLFFLLDLVFWQSWSLLVFSVQYLGPLLLLIQLIRLIRADADLSLLTYEQFGMMPSSLRGKVVWVTGCSSGIGEALAYVLTKAGCKIVLSARRKQELDRVKQACLDLPGCFVNESDIMVLPLDITQVDKHTELVNEVVGYFGRIDILVNNAARSIFMDIKDTPLSVDREMIDILAVGPISLTKAALPVFLKQGSGHVAVTSSLAGIVGSPKSASYCAGKFALHGYFETLRLEHCGQVEVTIICPGPVATSLLDNAKYGEKKMANNPHTDIKFMTAERCATLISVALANKVGECWTTPNPYLMLMYFHQYFPDGYRWLMKRFIKKLVIPLE